MTATLAGKIAIVTGAGGGIGGAIAQAFAQNGATVILADRSGQDAMAAAIGHDAQAMPLDVTSQASIDALADAVLDRHGRIDILVNGAGRFDATPLADVSHAHWQRIFDVNVFGLAAMSQAVIPAMTGQGSGRIINIASIGGRRADEKTIVYSASKAAVISITQAMALALARQGVGVNAIAPGPVRTALWEQLDRTFSDRYLQTEPGAFTALAEQATPIGAIAVPEDIAGTALFLASPASAHVIGQTINVDGGVMLN